MTTAEKKVKAICDEVYKKFPEQILIDFIQEEVEETLEPRDENDRRIPVSRDSVGALQYQCSLLLDIYNPFFAKDVDILNRLQLALKEWYEDVEGTNKLLGLPKES